MHKIHLRFLSFFLVLILAVGFVRPALAHGGQPRLEINVERPNPGGIVDVRGVEFDYEEVVTLTLISSQVEISVGDITTNVDGEFTYIVTLPIDLAEGTYYIRGTTTHHWVLSPALIVWGSAVIEDEGEGRLDEEEGYGLLVPMPTFAPAAQAVSTVPASVASAPVEAIPAITWNPMILALAALAIIVLVVMLRLGRKRSK